jgi:antimicrobial peptide system SdpA family protein
MFALILIIVWLIVAAYALHGSLKSSVIRLPEERAVKAAYWLPQGWAFFTRDPREPQVVPLRVLSGGRWVSLESGPYGRLNGVFGLDRSSKAQGVEIGMILHDIPDKLWRECDEAVPLCLNKMTDGATEENRALRKTLCGDLAFVSQPILPWTMAQHRLDSVIRTSRVARIYVDCRRYKQ